MRSVPADVLARLDLPAAAIREADHTEALLPDAPGAAQLRAGASPFAAWLGGQVRGGLATGRGLVVAVAEPETGGSRPVAIWGFAERVTYRALTDLLLAGAELDRSPERYREFVAAPAKYAEERGERPGPYDDLPFSAPWPYEAAVRYVVKADLASFYQYVDHEILGRELLIRAVRRREWAAWRFNDDFRIAVTSFEEAKRARRGPGMGAQSPGVDRHAARAGSRHRRVRGGRTCVTPTAPTSATSGARSCGSRTRTSHARSRCCRGWKASSGSCRHEPAVRAEAALALASAGLIDARHHTRALDQEPSALAGWYLLALRRLDGDGRHDAPRGWAQIMRDGGVVVTGDALRGCLATCRDFVTALDAYAVVSSGR
nr:hypothetical protein [uncultured Actinoplanes sp.]